jgi:hypothetical protein
MSENKKFMMDLIEKDKKKQRELYEKNKNMEISLNSDNEISGENSEEMKRRLGGMQGKTFNTAGNNPANSRSTADNVFSNVLSQNNFAKGMALGTGSNLLNNTSGAGNLSGNYDFVQFQVKNIDIIINDEKVDFKDVDFRISEIMNNHSILYLNFTFSSSQTDKYKSYVYTLMNTIQLELNRLKETGEEDFKSVFDGIIEDVEITESRGEYSAGRITAYSKTILMDKVPKLRSFQNIDLTVDKVIKEIGTEYPEIAIHIDDTLVGKKIPHMMLQIEETDFEFINRILNIMNYSLSCHLGSLVCGLLELTVYDLPIKTELYTSMRQDRNLLYKVKGTNPFNVVEKINIIDEESEVVRVVYSSDIWVENDIVQCEMILLDLHDKQLRYEFPLIKNNNMMGRVIEGKVIEIGAEEGIAVMTLDLTSGLAKLTNRKSAAYPDKYAGSFKFPYMTPMSQTNTGFWPSPEPNDLVVLVIDDFNESFSYVQGAVNNPGNGRFSDPTVRNFTLPPDPSVTSPENAAPYNQMGIKNSSSGTYGKKGDDSGNKAAHQSGGRPAAHFQLDSSKFVVDVTSFISLSAKNSVSIDSQNTMGITAKNVMGVSSDNIINVDGKNLLAVNSSAGIINITSKGFMFANSEASIIVSATNEISHQSQIINSEGTEVANYGGGAMAVLVADDIKLNG